MRKTMLAVIGILAAGTAPAQSVKAPVAEASTVVAPSADAIVGHYRFKSGLDMSIEKTDVALIVKSTGQQPQSLSTSPDGKFNYLSIPGYLTFDLDPSGKAKTLHFHYDDKSLPAARVDEAAAKKASDALQLKIKNQTADPACAVTLKRIIEELRAGKPDYSKMTLTLAQTTRVQLPMMQQKFQEFGAVKEMKFTGVGPMGAEIFSVEFEKQATEWRAFCLGNGYVSGLGVAPKQ